MLVRSFNKILDNIYSNKWSTRFLYFLLISYLIIFIIFYSIYGLKIIGIHTNLFIPIFVIIISNFFINKVICKNTFDNIKYISTVYFIIEFALIIISPDIIDRNIGIQYNADKYNSFQSFYHIRKPNIRYKLKQKEFNFERKSNSLGISEIEFFKEKENDKIRIICLGDSFTEGDGTHKDSTYVKFLEKKLTKKYQNIELINAGRCGSDPFFDFKLLKDILIEYHPDIIIQSFTSNDFYHDIPMRGGKERFQPNYKLKHKNDHWWEPIYAASFTARIIIQTFGGYDKFLVKTKERPLIEAEMIQKCNQLFQEYQSYLNKRNVDLILFTLPFKQDMEIQSHNDEFYKIFEDDFRKKGIEFYNLEDCYSSHISQNKTQIQDYYWVEDGHHNAQGYGMMAHCVEEIVLPILEKNKGNKNTLLN